MYFKIFLILHFSTFSLIFLVLYFLILFQSLEFHNIYIYYIPASLQDCPDTLLSGMSEFACDFPHIFLSWIVLRILCSLHISFNCLSFFINRHIFFSWNLNFCHFADSRFFNAYYLMAFLALTVQ